MTDSEKLDLLLSEITGVKDDVQGIKNNMQGMEDKMQNIEMEIQDVKKEVHTLKLQTMKSTAELKAMDEMILDEVERVHIILENHKANKAVHTA
ncbi:MAG: hypothetical protein HFI76_09590 [Lachnospiraceae bacterium]|jgi:archaellum component FlaC|nr:hypothetical protein [Lachnospiraceae bacterium]